MGKKSKKISQVGVQLREQLRHEKVLIALSERARDSNHPDSNLFRFFALQTGRALERARKLEDMIKKVR